MNILTRFKFPTIQISSTVLGLLLLFSQSGFDWQKYHWLRLLMVGGSLTSFTASLVAGSEYRRRRPYWELVDEANYQAHYDRLFGSGGQTVAIAPDSRPSDLGITLYNWSNIADEAVGFIVAGNSGSGKSSVALWLLGQLTRSSPAKILILDPHCNRNHWPKNIPTLWEFDQIEATITKLITELDRRRGLPENGDDIIVVADELNACLKSFQDPSKLETALLRLGSEGRKFGITLIAINQSSNCETLGIDAKYRDNYCLILLGASARQRAGQVFKKSSIEWQWLNQQPYPCLLSGSLPDALAPHPTHQHHKTYRTKGNLPANITEPKMLPGEWGSDTSVMSSHSDFVLPKESPAQLSDDKIFNLIKSGRETGVSKTALIAQIWDCEPSGSNMSRARVKSPLNEYERILDAYCLPWILELIEQGHSPDEILKTVWGNSGGHYRKRLQKIYQDHYYEWPESVATL